MPGEPICATIRYEIQDSAEIVQYQTVFHYKQM